MPHFCGNLTTPLLVVTCLAMSPWWVACSGADLGTSTKGQGTTPVDTTSTGGTNGNNTSVGSTGGSSSSSSTKTSAGGSATSATGGSASTGAPTWQQLYDNYFKNSCESCHGVGIQPSFNSASTMCTALKQAGYIQNGKATLQNLLTWFGKGGSMPQGGGTAPPNAVADINAWQSAGAVCP